VLTNTIRRLKILPRWVIIALDLTIVGFSCFIGYLLRFNFSVSDIVSNNILLGVSVYMMCGFLSILTTNSYKGIIRYTGVQDGVRIIYMVGLTTLVACIINLISKNNIGFNVIPYSVILISFLSSFLFLFNYRLLVKYIFTYYKNAILKKSRVLIFGAGQTGIITRHLIDSSPRMRIAGYLEDDKNKVGKVLDGAKIYSADSEELDMLLKELNIDELIFTVKDISLERKNEVVDICIKNQVKIRTIPPVEKWVRGELSFNQIKEINIEDLLGRESIKIKNENVESDIRGKRILITGAAGSIGSELVRQVLLYNPETLVLVDQAESPLYEMERELKLHTGVTKTALYLADITNRERMSAIFRDHRPEIIYHAAAYKHVPVMESNPSEAVSCNILGTKMMADLAIEVKAVKFVMVSTDKAVNPTNVMGCSKRIAEIYVQSLNNHLQAKAIARTSFVTTRFGNVLGSNGSVIPLFKKQIKMGGPITVTHPEVSRFFMTIPEACQLVIEAGTMGKGGEIFIFDMGKSIKIMDLAKKMIHLSGLDSERDINIVFTGLREGEKLYEELLTKAENTMPTHHHKIMIAKVQEYEYIEINKYIELFNDLVNDRNELKMVALMKELVPEFVSNYSRYEVLDVRE
jgi:FlaA1/EpsC-like NDP-sugar epimerase